MYKPGDIREKNRRKTVHESDAVRHRFAYHTLLSVPRSGPVPDGVPTAKPIVVGLKGTEASDAALRWSVNLAQEIGAEVIAVHAVSVATEFLNDAEAFMPSWRRDLRAKILTEWCEPIKRAGVAYRAMLVERPVRAALVGVAERTGAASIVVGRGEGHGNRHRVLPGLYASLVDHAPCPLVTVPLQLAKSQLSPVS
jgi:nucleotide-binding universal stress UspA family protein